MTCTRSSCSDAVKKFSFSSLLLFTCCVWMSPCEAVTSTWNVTGGGNWNTGTNWDTNPVVPNAALDIAQLTSSIIAPSTITLTTPITLQQLYFDNATQAYTVTGSSFTLGNSPVLFTQNGDHQIDSPINLTSDLIVYDDLGSSLTITAPITGNFSVTKNDPGTLFLTGVNTYSGGTVINAGTLSVVSDDNLGAPGTPLIFGLLGGELDIAGNLSSSRPVVLNGAETFFIFPTFTSTLSGNISGSGGLVKAGDGELILTGNNNYLGTTVIANGTLQVTTNSLPGDVFIPPSLQLQVLIFDQDFDGSYNGSIIGPPIDFGSVEKQGTGRVSFNGSSNYAGQTLVEEGTLVIDGIVKCSDFIVFPGATLGGTGTLEGIVTVSGNLAPGSYNSIMDINGTMTLNPSSNFNIGINQFTSTLVDIASVSVALGDAIIIDSNLNVTVAPGVYPTGMTYTVIQTTGGVTTLGGGFTSITSNAPAMHFSAIYNPFDVQLVFDSISFGNVVTEGNPGAVAACVDTATPVPGSDFANVILNLASLTTEELYDAFNQMQPAPFKALPVSQQYISLEVQNALSYRYTSCFPAQCENHRRKKPNTVWLDLFGSAQTQDKKTVAPHSPIPSYTTKTFGALLGLDHVFNGNFCAGVVTGYTYGKLSMHADVGHGHVETAYLGPYGQYQTDAFYLNGTILGEMNWYKTFRNMNFNTINRTAKGYHDGYSGLAHLGAGTWIRKPRFDLSPFVNLDVIAMYEDSYRESGAESLDLHVRSSHYLFGELEGGGLIRTCFHIPQGVIIPEARFSVIGEHRFESKHYRASLPDTNGCSFSVKGNYPNQVLLVPAASLKALLYQERLTAALRYQGKYGSHFSFNEFALDLGWSF